MDASEHGLFTEPVKPSSIKVPTIVLTNNILVLTYNVLVLTNTVMVLTNDSVVMTNNYSAD